MSKIAAYLREHIAGEVTTDEAVRAALSTDMSVLTITPEMVVYPRTTNDIRKVARFAWQLAEKGHVLPITARGRGTDQTAAAIGKGVVLVTPAHMNRIFEYDSKQKLVRLQPGVTGSELQSALSLHGAGVPALPLSAAYSTIGGAVANNATGPLSGKFGSMESWISQLEVVLSNGDVLQTQRVNKRELSRLKGMQTFEGEIYRSIDNLIEDNKQLIDEKLDTGIRDNVGYSSITQVKRSDGSFDLTPLIVGSQGTLGIVSEMIIKAEFMSLRHAVAVLSFANHETARDVLDQLRALAPTYLEYYDGELFAEAQAAGRSYEFYKQALSQSAVEAVVLVGFEEFNERSRAHKLKRVLKLIGDSAAVTVSNDENSDELLAIREVTAFGLRPEGRGVSAPPLLEGAYIPPERFEDFTVALKALADKHHVRLPLHGRALDNVYYARPQLELRKVGDKQKIFKLLDEYASLVDHHGGHIIGEAGEGRLKARFAYANLDDDVLQLFAEVKAIFDPYGILNPGVKQASELKQLVSQLRTDYDTGTLASYSPYN